MFNKLKLTPKIVGSIALTLLVTSAVGFFVTRYRVNTQAEDAFVDKLRKTDGMAGAVRTYFSANVETYVPNHDFKQVKQVPVVVAWNIAREYAESQGMKFSTPSLQPRNPQHTADDFEREALTKFQNDGALKEYFKRSTVDGQTVMRYAQPVRLTEDCLFCHGDPAGEKDPFGFAKEGMKTGDLRGAFVVTAPLAAVEEASVGNSLTLLLLSVVTMVAGSAVIFFLVQRFVIRPVAAAAMLADQIASNNLTVSDIEVRSQDEIGDASAALNEMKNGLHDVIQSIRGTADQVAAASEELSATSQQITANSEETTAQAKVVSEAGGLVNANLQTLASGAEEMNSTIGEIAKNATEAARVSAEAVAAADAANDTVSKLGASSVEIEKVIEVITSIAQQTNLLALNATIEAARAGEAGKGFAVVANEVKELAKQTAKATEEIKQKIAAIRTNTGGAVEAISGIKGVIDQVSQISTTIATAVEEQSATTSEMTRNVNEAARGASTISENIKGVATAAQDTSTNVGESQVASEQLAKMATELRELVGRFKLDSGYGKKRDEDPAMKAARQAAGR